MVGSNLNQITEFELPKNAKFSRMIKRTNIIKRLQ